MSDIHVKIIKKSAKANYPEHIIVEKKSTRELVHLYLDKGILKKFTHIIPSKNTQNPYTIQNTFDVENGIFSPQNTPNVNSFYTRVLSSLEQKRGLFFFDKDLNVAFSFKMNLRGQCLPNYISNYSAEITEIYPHQERRTCPNLKISKEHAHD